MQKGRKNQRNQLPGDKKRIRSNKKSINFEKKRKKEVNPHVLKIQPYWEQLMFHARSVHINSVPINGFSVKKTRKSFIFKKEQTLIFVSTKGGRMVVDGKTLLLNNKTFPRIIRTIENIRVGLKLPPKKLNKRSWRNTSQQIVINHKRRPSKKKEG